MSNQVGKGLYLYCFFAGRKLPCPSVDGVSPNYAPFSLSHRQISAALSFVPLDEYADDQRSADQNGLSWIAPRILAHKRIIEAIAAVRPVIPVRFGAVFTERERILEILTANYSVFMKFFRHIRDKQEWGVRVYADARPADEVACGVRCGVNALDDKDSAASPGEAYLLEKKKSIFLKEEFYKALGTLGDNIYRAMALCAFSSCKNKLLDASPRGGSREIILNAAFLTAKGQAEDFKKRVREVALAYDDGGLFFEINGPWPPYSFCPPVQYPDEGSKN